MLTKVNLVGFVSTISKIVCSSGLSDLYRRGVKHAKQYASASTLDKIELVALVVIPVALVGYGILSRGMVTAACGLACGLFNAYVYDRHLKKPVIEQEIDTIITNSKGKEKSALFIHTKKDHNGAFTELHTVAEVYQHCSQKHSIDRIRGFSYAERLKVQGRKFDVVHVMAHGDPSAADMDEDSFPLTNLASKKINFLSARVKDGGKLILNVCEAAKGEENLAKYLSAAIPHATVYASSASIHALVGDAFDEEMTPTFNNGTFCVGQNTTRVYKQGQLIQ